MEKQPGARKRQMSLTELLPTNGSSQRTKRIASQSTQIIHQSDANDGTSKVDDESPTSCLTRYRLYLGEKTFAERMRPSEMNQSVDLPEPCEKARTLISGNMVQSVVVWGDTGAGKTTWSRIFCRILAKRIGCRVVSIAGPQLSTKDIAACHTGPRVVLFCDEIHRISKVQQDALLGPIETGHIVLVGVTTENPFAVLNKAICSRCQVLKMPPACQTRFANIITEICTHLGPQIGIQLVIECDAIALLFDIYGSDIRSALNTFENELVDRLAALEAVGIEASPEDDERKVVITKDMLVSRGITTPLLYDANDRYDLISAYQKSIRGSDRDAAMYYLARLLEGGEDPLYVARRLITTAAEDCDSMLGYQTAVAAYTATQVCGMPEARLHLAYATKALCEAPKSIASYTAYNRACEMIREEPRAKVPPAIANSGPKRGLYLKPNQTATLTPKESRERYSLQSYLPEQFEGASLFDEDVTDSTVFKKLPKSG